jgi:hypothetical protein
MLGNEAGRGVLYLGRTCGGEIGEQEVDVPAVGDERVGRETRLDAEERQEACACAVERGRERG